MVSHRLLPPCLPRRPDTPHSSEQPRLPARTTLPHPECLFPLVLCRPPRRGPGAPHNSELARLGARTMLHMMIVDNLIHADLHPGNILGELRLVLRCLSAAAAAGCNSGCCRSRCRRCRRRRHCRRKLYASALSSCASLWCLLIVCVCAPHPCSYP